MEGDNPMLQRSNSSIEVEKLQEILVSLGYKLKIDGDFGLLTEIVVKDFQRHAGLVIDGIVGPKTKAVLASYDARTFCPEVFEEVLGIENNTDQQIEKAMRYGFVGLGSIFNQVCRKYSYRWSHAVARGALESAWHTSKISVSKNNIFGFMAYDSSPFASAKRFKSPQASIEFWIPWMIKNYLSKTGKYYNGNSEYGINQKYSTSPIAGISVGFLIRSIRESLLVRDLRQKAKIKNE